MEGPSLHGLTVSSVRASSSSMPPAATVAPAPTVGVTPSTLPAPALPHSFTRVIIPGTDKELDYISVAKGADVVKPFPTLGW